MQNLWNYLVAVDPQTGKLRLNYTRIAKMVRVDPMNLKGQLLKGKLTPKMEAAVLEALPRINLEVHLFSFEDRMFASTAALRADEELARQRLLSVKDNLEDSDLSVDEQIQEALELALTTIVDSRIDTIERALPLLLSDTDEPYSKRDITTMYLAAVTLHTCVVLWELAATLAIESNPEGRAHLAKLDLLVLDVEQVETVIDATRLALSLYAEVEQALRAEARKLHRLSAKAIKDARDAGDAPSGIALDLRKDEETKALVASQDAEFTSLQIASLLSYVFDWRHAQIDFLLLMGIPVEEATRQLTNFAGDAATALKAGVPMLKRLPKHLLLARNVAYIGLQFDQKEALTKAVEALIAETGWKEDEVWSGRIADRTPLNEELHLQTKFIDGKPTILAGKE